MLLPSFPGFRITTFAFFSSIFLSPIAIAQENTSPPQSSTDIKPGANNDGKTVPDKGDKGDKGDKDDKSGQDALPAAAAAQNMAPFSPINADTLLQQALANSFHGDIDRVDPHSGVLHQNYVDLHLPGNGGLDISLQRSYSGHNRINPLAYIGNGAGIGWRFDFGRVYVPVKTSLPNEDPNPCGIERYNERDAAYNPVLDLPGRGRQTMTYISASPVTMLASDRTRVVCKPGQEGMTVFLPSGIRYEMTHKVKGVRTSDFSQCCMFNNQLNSWYVTQIADRNGNTIQIRYKSADSAEMQQVAASDGRVLDFTYLDSGTSRARLESVASGKLRVSYQYQPVGSLGHHLTKVILADGSSYQYDYYPGAATTPDKPALGSSFLMSKTTVPSGGSIEYAYVDQPYHCNAWLCAVLSQRTKSDGVNPPQTWEFYYYAQACQTATLDCTYEKGPLGHSVLYFFHRYPNTISNIHWRYGLLLQKTTAGAKLEKFEWDADKFSSQNAMGDQGFWVPKLSKYSLEQDGASYTTQFESFDQYGNPASILESGYDAANNSATSRRTNVEYLLHDNAQIWDIRKPRLITRSDGLSIRHDYDDKGRLAATTQNGIRSAYDYDAEGNLSKWVTPRGHEYWYRDYKRGIARQEFQPEGTNLNLVVNDEGTVQSETDGEGKTTAYEYDGLKRVTKITPARGAATTISYTPNSKSAQRGSLLEKTEWDGFGRVLKQQKGDISQSFRYDAFGRKTFASAPNSEQGEVFEYDLLNRPKLQTFADGARQSWVYGKGTTSATNQRGHTTNYFYRSYGNPQQQELMRIAPPLGDAAIEIKRRANGQIESVTQAGQTRIYDYNDKLQLTGITHPEIGRVVYGRDEAGNMTSRQIPGGALTSYVYDGQNRLTEINYQGMSALMRRYDRNGLLKSVSFNGSVRSYEYDANRNLLQDSLQLDNLNFVTSYEYDELDHLSAITYPFSRNKVSLAPNLQGLATGLSTATGVYLKQAQYWPSGQIKSLEYGNGTRSEYEQNARLWPSSFITSRAGQVLENQHYFYDPAGNLEEITAVNTNVARKLAYDALDRLNGAKGGWGEGTLAYDGSGNLLGHYLGSYGLQYHYDDKLRLKSVNGYKNASFSYNPDGSIAGGLAPYQYDTAGQLTCVFCLDAQRKTAYGYDGLGRRVWVEKNTPQGVKKTYEIHDSQGRLLLEYRSDKTNTEHIYLQNQRIAQRQYRRP